jgi:hypothetical protein
MSSNSARITNLDTKTTDISYTDGTTSISGNLTVLGNTTTLDTVNLIVQDPILQLSNASASVDSGILIARPSDTDNVFVGFDQSLSEFAIGFTDSHAGLNEIVVKDGQDFTLNVHGNVEASYYFGDGIGIGTTDPAYPLDVNGIVNAISFRASGTISNFTVTAITGAFIINGVNKPVVTLYRGVTYRFDQSDSSNGSHPFRISTTAEGSQYSSGTSSSYNGSNGSIGAYREFIVPTDAPDTMYYNCSVHSGMGNTINILSGSVNTSGLVASNVSIQNQMDITDMNITSGLKANGSTGSSGQVLTSSGGGAMTWTTPSSFSGDIAEYITHTGNTSNDLFGFPNNNEFKIRTGGIDRLNIDSSGNLTIPDYIRHSGGDTDTYFGFPSNDTVSINTNGTERFRIISGGNIGIGTTTPESPLHIECADTTTQNQNGLLVKQSSSSHPAIIGIRTSSPSQDPFISFMVNSDNTGWSYGVDASDSNKMKWAYNPGNLSSSTIMTLTNDEKLGIGTTDPTQKLQVNDGNILMSGAWSSGVYFSLMGYDNAKQIQFNYDDGTWISDNNSIRFGVGGSQSASGLYSERMRITSGGDVGIGTISPNYRLDVNGTMNITSGLYANGSTGSSGQVLTSSSGGAMTWTTPSSFSGDIADYITHTGDSSAYFGFPFDDTFTITTSNTERFRINSIGGVVIATATSGYSLDVNGTMNITSGLYANGSTGSNGQVLTSSGGGAMSWTTVSSGGSSPWTTSGSNIYRSSGNVGIGTTNPLTPLHVVGNADITGGLRANGSTGSNGQVLTSSGGGAMSWTTVSSGSSFSGDIVDYITHTGNTSNDLFGFPNNNEFKIRTGGIDRLNIDSSGNLTIPDYIRHSGDTNTYFGFSSTDTFVVSTSGSVRFLVNAIGEGTIGLNTGMGSGHMFAVVDGSTSNDGSYADLVITNMSEHNNARLLLGTSHNTNSSSAFKAAIIADGAGTYSRNDLHFCLEGSTDNTANADLTDSKMMIKYDTGNVGIGTTTPGYKLDVNGNMNITSGL